MATELEKALFLKEWGGIQDLPEAARWKLERDSNVPLGLFVTLSPVKYPKEVFRARLHWTDYFGPVSLKFVNLQTGATSDPQAWPRCKGFRPSSMDACLSWTAEGHALHPEWKNSFQHSFPKVELPMQFALLTLQHSLDGQYEGRGP